MLGTISGVNPVKRIEQDSELDDKVNNGCKVVVSKDE